MHVLSARSHMSVLRQVETLGLNCIVLLANDNSRMWIPVWKLAEANLVNLSRSEKHIDFVKVRHALACPEHPIMPSRLPYYSFHAQVTMIHVMSKQGIAWTIDDHLRHCAASLLTEHRNCHWKISKKGLGIPGPGCAAARRCR